MYEIRIIVQICSSFRTFGNRCIRYAAICHSFIQFLIKVVQLSLIQIFAEDAKNRIEKMETKILSIFKTFSFNLESWRSV